jgi:hypothetical protein
MDTEFFKRYPIFTGLVAVCVLAFAVELFLVFRASSATAKADRALRSAVGALSTTLSATPATTSDNLQAAQQNLADLQKQLNGIVQTLGKTGNFSEPPADAVTLMGDAQHFVDDFNAQAKSKGIVIVDPANFTFGMGQYWGPVTPPPPDKIPVVFKQMEILEYILKQLFAAKPADQQMILESVERENEVVVTNQGSSANDEGPKDTFAVPPLVSAKQPGAVDTLAFRLKFIAYTDTLRAFLNELAQFDYPLVVRSVEVQQASEDTVNAAASPAAAAASSDGNVSLAAVVLPTGDTAAATPDASATPAPAAPAGPVRQEVITNNLSEFTVVIEYINLVPPKTTGAPSA